MKKVILITGASSGIGHETAQHLNKLGYCVYATSRNLEGMDDLKDQGCKLLPLDVTKESDITKVVAQIIADEGKIDALLNNAGFGLFGAVEDVPIDDARNQFEVNLFGLARVTQEVLPYMRKAKSGTIINISSIAGKMYTPMGAWYHASKHAVEGLSDSLRLELQPFNIKVAIVEPGIIRTNFATMTGALKRYSGSGAYKKLANKMIQSTESTYGPEGGGSDPIVIAKTIEKILASDNPKTRYPVGKNARLLIYSRALLSDKLFDKLLLRSK